MRLSSGLCFPLEDNYRTDFSLCVLLFTRMHGMLFDGSFGCLSSHSRPTSFGNFQLNWVVLCIFVRLAGNTFAAANTTAGSSGVV